MNELIGSGNIENDLMELEEYQQKLAYLDSPEITNYGNPEKIARAKEIANRAIEQINRKIRQKQNIQATVQNDIEAMNEAHKAKRQQERAEMNPVERGFNAIKDYSLKTPLLAGELASNIALGGGGFLARSAGNLTGWKGLETIGEKTMQANRDFKDLLDIENSLPSYFEGTTDHEWNSVGGATQNVIGGVGKFMEGYHEFAPLGLATSGVGAGIGMTGKALGYGEKAVKTAQTAANLGLFASSNVANTSDYIEQTSGKFKPIQSGVSSAASALAMEIAFALGRGRGMNDVEASNYATRMLNENQFVMMGKKAFKQSFITAIANGFLNGGVGTWIREEFALPDNPTQEDYDRLASNVWEAFKHETAQGAIWGGFGAVQYHNEVRKLFNQLGGKETITTPDGKKRSVYKTNASAKFILENSEKLQKEKFPNLFEKGSIEEVNTYLDELFKSVPEKLILGKSAEFGEQKENFKAALLREYNLAFVEYSSAFNSNNRFAPKIRNAKENKEAQTVNSLMANKVKGLYSQYVAAKTAIKNIDIEIEASKEDLQKQQELARQKEELQSRSYALTTQLEKPYSVYEMVGFIRNALEKQYGQMPEFMKRVDDVLSKYMGDNWHTPISADEAMGVYNQITGELSKLDTRNVYDDYNSKINNIVNFGQPTVYGNDERNIPSSVIESSYQEPKQLGYDGVIYGNDERGALPESRQLGYDGAIYPEMVNPLDRTMPLSVRGNEKPILPGDVVNEQNRIRSTQSPARSVNEFPVDEYWYPSNDYKERENTPPSVRTKNGRESLGIKDNIKSEPSVQLNDKTIAEMKNNGSLNIEQAPNGDYFVTGRLDNGQPIVASGLDLDTASKVITSLRETKELQNRPKMDMPRDNMNISQPKEQLPINDRISGKSTSESPSSFKESTSSLNIPQASKSENVPPRNKMKIDSTDKIGSKAVRDSESFDTIADMPQSVMTDRTESPAIKNERGKMGLDVEMKQKEAVASKENPLQNETVSELFDLLDNPKVNYKTKTKIKRELKRRNKIAVEKDLNEIKTVEEADRLLRDFLKTRDMFGGQQSRASDLHKRLLELERLNKESAKKPNAEELGLTTKRDALIPEAELKYTERDLKFKRLMNLMQHRGIVDEISKKELEEFAKQAGFKNVYEILNSDIGDDIMPFVKIFPKRLKSGKKSEKDFWITYNKKSEQQIKNERAEYQAEQARKESTEYKAELAKKYPILNDIDTNAKLWNAIENTKSKELQDILLSENAKRFEQARNSGNLEKWIEERKAFDNAKQSTTEKSSAPQNAVLGKESRLETKSSADNDKSPKLKTAWNFGEDVDTSNIKSNFKLTEPSELSKKIQKLKNNTDWTRIKTEKEADDILKQIDVLQKELDSNNSPEFNVERATNSLSRLKERVEYQKKNIQYQNRKRTPWKESDELIEARKKAEFYKKAAKGNLTRMTTKANGGMTIDGQFGVVDVNDLQTATSIGETQNRNRETISSQAQINSIGNNPNPEYLIVNNPDSANGAMVITADGRVLSGNGRTLGLKMAYESGNAEKYKAYLREHAKEFGINPKDVDKIKNPVLVRIVDPKEGFDLKRFVKESNESQQLARNAAEIARTDAENIKGILRDFNSVEDIASSSNKEFIQKFFDKTVGNTERAMYLAEDGSLTPDGRRRVENALIASLYGDNPRLIEKLTNTTNEGIKNIANALISTARDGAKLKGEIDKGRFFDIDFTKEIGDAALAYADTIAEMKRQGIKPLDSKGNGTSPLNFYLKNMKDRLTPESKLIFGMLSEMHKSPKQTREFLQIINDVIRSHGDPQQGDLFAGKNQKPSKSQVIKEVLQEFDSRYKTDFSKRDLSEWNKSDRTLFGSRARNKVTNSVSDKDLNNFLKGQAKQITKETGLKFKVVSSVDELSKIAGEQLDAKTEGGIQGDTVYIVRGNVDKERFPLFIAHEVAGHRGVEALFDSKEQMDSFFKSLERASDRDRFISDAFAEVDRLGYTKNRSREAMAKIVEKVRNESGTLKGTAKTFVNFITSRVRRLLRRMGFKNLQLNEAEVYDIAVQALRRTGLKNSNKFFGLDRFLAKDNSFLSATSTELDKKYPNWLKDQEKASGAHSTQIEQTKETYKKIGEFMKQNGMGNKKILDASSGMGYGTEELRKMGFDIEDVEPYPGDDREFKPTYGKDYKDYKEIYRKHGKTYDVIISNAVLNVIPDDWRREQLHAMADVLLKDGGKIFLNVRDTKEIENQTQKIELDSPREILVTNAKGDKITAYQRGFDQAELEYWLTKELGRGYTVEAVKESNSGLNKGTRAVVITKNSANTNKTAKQVRNDITKRLTPDQLANREFNNSAQPMSNLKTLKSKKNTLGRYKGIVGKDIGDQLYVHKNYADEVIPVDKLNKARQILSETNPDFKYKTIMWDKKKGTIRFDEAPNFDTAPEPIPGVMITVDPETGNVRKSYSQNIWHHKWQWVKDDYKGFDTRKSWERSREWLNGLADLELDKEDPYFGVANKGVANGRQLGYGGWNDQLYYYGLDHMIDDTNNTVPLDSYKEGLKVIAEQKAIDKALKASMPKEAKPKKAKPKKAEGEFLASRPRTREEARSPKEFYGEKRWNAIKSYKKNKGVVDNLLPTIDEEAYEGYEKLPDGIQAMQNITNNGELLADLDHALRYHYKSDIIDTLNHIKERVAQTYDEKFADKIAKRCDRIIRMTEKGEYDASKIKPISLKELEKQKIKEMPKTDWDLDREYYKENDLIDPVTQTGHGWVQRGDGSYEWLSSIGEKSTTENVAGKRKVKPNLTDELAQKIIDEVGEVRNPKDYNAVKKIAKENMAEYKDLFSTKKNTGYKTAALKLHYLTGYKMKNREVEKNFRAIKDFNVLKKTAGAYIRNIIDDKSAQANLLDKVVKANSFEKVYDIITNTNIAKEKELRQNTLNDFVENMKNLKAKKVSSSTYEAVQDIIDKNFTREELDGLLNTNEFTTKAVSKLRDLADGIASGLGSISKTDVEVAQWAIDNARKLKKGLNNLIQKREEGSTALNVPVEKLAEVNTLLNRLYQQEKEARKALDTSLENAAVADKQKILAEAPEAKNPNSRDTYSLGTVKENLAPVTAVNSLDNDNITAKMGKTMHKVAYENLLEGQNRQDHYRAEGYKVVDDIYQSFGKNGDLRDGMNNLNETAMQVKTSKGHTYDITKGEVLAAVATYMDSETRQIIDRAGGVDFFLGAKRDSDYFTLTTEKLKEMTDSLTPLEKKALKKGSKLLSQVFLPAINETHERLNGVPLRIREDGVYFPRFHVNLDESIGNGIINRDSAPYLHQQMNADYQAMLKQRNSKARPSLMLKSFPEVLNSYVDQGALYIGMAEPLRHLNRVMTEGMKRELISRYGKEYVDRITTLTKNMAGMAGRTDADRGLSNKFLSNIAAAKLTPISALKQFSSVPLASSIIDFKYLAKAALSGLSNENIKEMMELDSMVLRYRNNGIAGIIPLNTKTWEGERQLQKHSNKWYNKIVDTGLNLSVEADKRALGIIYKATKLMAEAKGKGNDKAWIEKTFMDAVRRTQNTTDLASANGWQMKSRESAHWSFLNMYQNQTQKIGNEAVRLYRGMKEAEKQHGKDSAQYKEAKGRAVDFAIGVAVMNVMAIGTGAVAGSILHKKDEKETTRQKVADFATDTMFNLTGNPILKPVMGGSSYVLRKSLPKALGGSAQRTQSEMFGNDFTNLVPDTIYTAGKIFEEINSDDPAAKKFRKITGEALRSKSFENGLAMGRVPTWFLRYPSQLYRKYFVDESKKTKSASTGSSGLRKHPIKRQRRR